jgi:hypothetical protein
VRVTLVAAVYVLPPVVPPACAAVIEQVPEATMLTVDPLTVQIVGEFDV